MLKQSYFFSLILTLTLLSSSAFTQVTVSIPVDLSAKPGTTEVKIPVNVTDVTGLKVISADLIISYDTTVLTATGATLDGTIAAGGLVEPNPDKDGYFEISPLFGYVKKSDIHQIIKQT